ncbi:30S ribosomal protein S14 [Candidatus Pacearchaeota archaeon]|nr:30S ribosomal protein S14 [Candidatus Pacearchaeota archaeon]
MLKQLEKKPQIKAKFLKHNKPKDRKIGLAVQKCERCRRFGAHIKSYGLNLCRHCFREIAEEIGFRKFS